MPLESDEIEDEGVAVRVAAGLALDRPYHPFHVVDRLPGMRGVEIVPELGFGSALVENDDGTHTVQLGGDLSVAAAFWKTGHELGEFRMKRRRPFAYVGPDKERVANQLAGAILVPRPVLQALYPVYGESLASLARRLGATQLVTALRVGEALCTPVAVVGAHRVIRRGPGVLPSDARLLEIVRRGAEPPKGFRVVRFSDAPWCWAVLPAW